MFSSARRLLLCAALIAGTGFAAAAEPGHYGYGEKATPEQIAGWDIDVRGDDGAGLPAGKGTVDKGAELYAGAMRRPATEPLARAKAACPGSPAAAGRCGPSGRN